MCRLSHRRSTEKRNLVATRQPPFLRANSAADYFRQGRRVWCDSQLGRGGSAVIVQGRLAEWALGPGPSTPVAFTSAAQGFVPLPPPIPGPGPVAFLRGLSRTEAQPWGRGLTHSLRHAGSHGHPGLPASARDLRREPGGCLPPSLLPSCLPAPPSQPAVSHHLPVPEGSRNTPDSHLPSDRAKGFPPECHPGMFQGRAWIG